MVINKALFSHDSDEWETPKDLFDELDKEFHFEIDVCATNENYKCLLHFTPENDGLKADWSPWYSVWCNPPYSNIKEWAKKCSEHDGLAVMLVPARTDTKWFHEYCYNKPNVELRFIKGRLKFGESKNSAPFPSMIVIFRNQNGDNNGAPQD